LGNSIYSAIDLNDQNSFYLTLQEVGDVTDTTQFPDWASVINHPDVVSLGSDVELSERSSTILDVTI
jgi:hypothetical protein